MQPYIVNESKAKYGYSIHYEELDRMEQSKRH